MSIFSSSTFTWQQIGLFKLSTITFGIAVGTYWQEIFLPHLVPLIMIAIVSGVYVAYVYLRQH